MRTAIVQHGPALGLVLSRKDARDLSRKGRVPLDRSVVLAFKNFPKLFGADYNFDNSGADFRGFTTLLEARGRFTHPRSRRHLCPFEMFPTMNPSIEWLYSSFRDILKSYISAIGFQVKEAGPHERRFYFKDESLVGFEEARQRYDAGKVDDDLIGQLRNITFALWDDTKLALSFISGTFTESPGPACATLEAFSQEFGTDLILEKEGLAWDKFLTARELRNRLTHPKDSSDLDLSIGDMDMMMEVSGWWHSSVDGCFELNGQKLL